MYLIKQHPKKLRSNILLKNSIDDCIEKTLSNIIKKDYDLIIKN
jgi:hypothetical protein